MAYTQYLYRFKESNEYEYQWIGRYGGKREKRPDRKKATKEEIERKNLRNRQKYIRRLIKLNFSPGDYWCTLKYPKGTRKTVDEVRKSFQKFIRNLKGKYSRRGKELKWIARMEIGSKGGIHIHIILPRIAEGDKLIQDTWTEGRVNFEQLYEQGDYVKLAEYIVKPPKDDGAERQLSLFEPADQKKLRNYSCSRNLERPIPEKKEYSHRTVKKIIEKGIEASQGFYIDKNSIRHGINPYTGYSYLYYTEIKIKAPPRENE